MSAKKLITVSVQNLIEFSHQSGDLGTGFAPQARAVEGTRGHNALRKALRASLPEGESYDIEVPVSFCLEGEHIVIEVSGRIDGILQGPSGITIHEIKTTTHPLDTISHDHNPDHWAQAKCYAFIYCSRHNVDQISVKLTYYRTDEGTEKSFTDPFSADELAAFFLPMVKGFLDWQEVIHGWQETRNDSIALLRFPYEELRTGQGEMVDGIYNLLEGGGILFAQAPTGTGKTIAALYPAVKGLGDGYVSKIFYLTAKTTTRALAEKALEDMRSAGLSIKSVTMTAKEKICPNSVFACDPQLCGYASDYYARVKAAIIDAFRNDSMDRRVIEACAARHMVCPFELSLDLTLWSDVIICDYNYLFDPKVYLKRFFMQQSGDYCFLIDEAHNLADRAREMFSAQIDRKMFFKLKRAIKSEMQNGSAFLYTGLFDSVDRLYKYFLDTGRELSDEEDEKKSFYRVRRKLPDELDLLLARFIERAGDTLSSRYSPEFRDELLEIYFEATGFSRILEFYDENYVTCYDKTPANFAVKLYCVDPSVLLRKALDRGRSAVLFSATLSPMDYHIKMLGGGDEASVLSLPSPFPPENLCVYIDDTIATSFRSRHLTYDRIAAAILSTASAKTGNYLVFFPSFDYLKEVYFRFMGIKKGIRAICQVPGMSEAARQGFLDEFESAGVTSLVGFAVMGGVFGEGIDLAGEKLSGAVIVGVGLPQVCNERNIIRRHFDEQNARGFEYSYTYPGINRVLQAAGRVIRSENDRGVIVLLDERFGSYAYSELLPDEWHPVRKASDGLALDEVLEDFWG